VFLTHSAMNKYFVVICLVLLLPACKKDQSKNNAIAFNGITAIGPAGDIIAVDTSDWNTRDEWNEREFALFDTQLPERKSGISLIPFPNPFVSSCDIVPIGYNTGVSIDFCIVDRDFNVLLRGGSPTVRFMLSAGTLPKDTVRMYYRLLYNDSASYGHGDLVIVKPE
jgi:hypothetical protein